MGAVDLGILVIRAGRVLHANDTAMALLPSAPDLPAPEIRRCPECGGASPHGRKRLDTGGPDARRVLEVTFAGHAHRVSTVEGGDLLLVADVTRWVLAEERLQELNADLVHARDEALAADRAKTQFLATMSHELRTPLTAILGYGDLLADEAEQQGATWAQPDLALIRAAGEQLLQLINDVLDLTRLDTGQAVQLVPVPVPELLALVVATARPLAERGGNRLEVRADPAVETVPGDPRRLRQVLLNLVSNAAKFTDRGTVSVEVTRDGDEVLLAVTDTGIGIAADQIGRLFQPFVQVDASYTRRAGGSGLGLAISKRLCASMGIGLEVESRVGVGSTFRLRIPGARG
jgi:signal transduction histidine kinase